MWPTNFPVETNSVIVAVAVAVVVYEYRTLKLLEALLRGDDQKDAEAQEEEGEV